MIVDDDPLIREGLAAALGNDFNVHLAESRAAAIDLLRKLPAPPQAALVDLGLPPVPHRPNEGFRLIAELLAHSPEIRIFALSGQDEQSNARHARALGAIDFIAKPCAPGKIRKQLDDALAVQRGERGDKEPDGQLFGIIGQSPAITALRNQIGMYAVIPFPVLIEGESGCGKELVAAAIQKLGSKPGAPFRTLNCAAISPTLIEPTLFGHSKGAFTGAASAQAGFFEDAADGTLFLDEIGELPLELQTKLLRVLENGEYQRVGETETRKSRARIIAATNRNLRDAVKAGTFRSDLYHRLNVFSILVPPLRELGPVVAALLFASRAGSAMTAEIGLMRATEQISAMEMMAVNPIARIVAPRFWAGVISMPLLAALFSAVGVFGGYLVGVVQIGVDEGSFWSQMQAAVDFREDILNGVIKSFAFGIVVTVIALFEGYDAPPTAEGVSGATTRTVVTSSLAILMLDFVLTAIMFRGT
ncbi:MAG: hypothetical protein A2143_11000 [Gallionellales bacterium RBG_16_57_15]|nr:MAG: hypothetical protein A2143_11000 [Gallionellales bacterium RBG_16_57_15]